MKSQLTFLTDERSSEGVEVGQKMHHRALLFSLVDLLWCFLYFKFAQILFGCAYVCTNVCHSEDEVLLFGKHFGLSMNTRTYIRTSLPFVLDALGEMGGLVSSRHIRSAAGVVLQQSVVCGQPRARVQVSVSTAPYTLC